MPSARSQRFPSAGRTVATRASSTLARVASTSSKLSLIIGSPPVVRGRGATNTAGPSICLAAVSAYTNCRTSPRFHKRVFPISKPNSQKNMRHVYPLKRVGEAGARRKPPDQAEPYPDDASGAHEPHEVGSASTEPAEAIAPTGKTTTGRPRPAASTREAQDPEPEKQAEGMDEGPKPAGQGEETNPTKPRPAPEAATAETSAAEREARRPVRWTEGPPPAHQETEAPVARATATPETEEMEEDAPGAKTRRRGAKLAERRGRTRRRHAAGRTRLRQAQRRRRGRHRRSRTRRPRLGEEPRPARSRRRLRPAPSPPPIQAGREIHRNRPNQPSRPPPGETPTLSNPPAAGARNETPAAETGTHKRRIRRTRKGGAPKIAEYGWCH
jgi:hypothetical protein